MRRTFFFVLVLSSCAPVFGQKNFEGEIRYDVLVYDNVGGGDGKMTLFFGKPGIRLEFTSAKEPQKPQEVIIFNFDSGLLLKLNPALKTYTGSPLKKSRQREQPLPKTLAGYRTTPVAVEMNGFVEDASDVFGAAVLYPADSLSYAVPAAFVESPELMMVNRGRIVLGGEFYRPERRSWPLNPHNYPLPKNDTALLFSVTAREVMPYPTEAALFVPSPDYAKNNDAQTFAVDSVDSAMMAMDTAVQIQSPKAVKKKKAPLKKKTTVKQNAVRRKHD